MKALIFGGGSDMVPDIARLFDDFVLLTQGRCDVTDFEEVSKFVNDSRPDIVINLAGVSNLQPVKESNISAWQEELAVNLFGSYVVAKATVEYNPSTIMIFIGSVAGKYGKKDHSGYCASKAGVISLVQSLDQEGYNAYCISPGRVNTKMRERDFPGERVETRLKTSEIAKVVKEILDGKHKPGDNVIIRKRGTRTLRRVDRGEPWKSYLNVGGEIVR